MTKLNREEMQKLAQENEALKIKLAAMEADRPQMENALGDTLSNEMKAIRQKGKSSANTITVQEKNDHVNISLWTRWGKRIGPLHPDNAIQTLNRFADIGILLTATRPTPAQLEAYKETAEYKSMIKREDSARAIKSKSKRSGQMDRLCAEIARMSGTTVEAINTLLKPHEVGKCRS